MAEKKNALRDAFKDLAEGFNEGYSNQEEIRKASGSVGQQSRDGVVDGTVGSLLNPINWIVAILKK